MANQRVPVSVVIPTKNEHLNLSRCLSALNGWAGEILVVDSQSTDNTVSIAEAHGAKVLQFSYEGGWPKKRQWALDTYDFQYPWILLLDADELLLDPIKQEIEAAIESSEYVGYWLRFQAHFLGVPLRYGGFDLWKLFLFRHGKGRYERRLASHEGQMGDIEIHEHVVVDGKVGHLINPVKHDNCHSLFRYIEKHNEYSEWEARVYEEGLQGELEESLFGNQAERRRWLKHKLLGVPGFPMITFVYHYIIRLGFVHGRRGFMYCVLKAIQPFHAKAKLYERQLLQEQAKRQRSS